MKEGSKEDAHEQSTIQAPGLTPLLPLPASSVPFSTCPGPAPPSHPEFSRGLPTSQSSCCSPSLLLPRKALLCYFVLFPARCQLSSASFFSPRFALPHSSGNQKQKKRKENRLDLDVVVVVGGGGKEGEFPFRSAFPALPASQYETRILAPHMTSALAHVCGHMMGCPAMPGVEAKGKRLGLSPTSLAGEAGGGCRRRSFLLSLCSPKAARPWREGIPRLR